MGKLSSWWAKKEAAGTSGTVDPATKSVEALADLMEKHMFRRAVRICNKLLKTGRARVILAAKLYCLLHLGCWQQALILAEEQQNATGPDEAPWHFARCYCLYRMQRTNQLQALLDKQPPHGEQNSYLLNNLEAQLAYRSQNYELSFKLCEHLAADNPDDYMVLTNWLASAVCLEMKTMPPHLEQAVASNEDAYELAYNLSCFHYEGGQYDLADEAAETAQRLCRKELGDNVSESHPELCALRVMRGSVWHRLGRLSDARAAYESVLNVKRITRIDPEVDATLFAVCYANRMILLGSTEGGISLIEYLRDLSRRSHGLLYQRLTKKQLLKLYMVHSLLLLKGNKVDECRAFMPAVSAKFAGTAAFIELRDTCRNEYRRSKKRVREAEQIKAAEEQAAKRRRKRRYPKGFDPANPGPPPDPNRWLPSSQRPQNLRRKRKLAAKRRRLMQ